MDVVAVIFLSIFFGLIPVAFAWIRYQDHMTANFVKRLDAQTQYDAAIMREAKLIPISARRAKLQCGVTGGASGRVIIFEDVYLDPAPLLKAQITDKDARAWRFAAQLVTDSRMKTGSAATQLITCDDWQVAGYRRDDWQAAVNVMASSGYVRTMKGGRDGGGVFTTDSRTLDSLTLELLERFLPPYVDGDPPTQKSDG